LFENRVLRRKFGPRRVEVRGEWRKVPKVELNVLYSSPNIIRVIKSRRIRWAGHAARRAGELYTWGNLRERDHLGDPGIYGRIVLRWVFRKCMWGY